MSRLLVTMVVMGALVTDAEARIKRVYLTDDLGEVQVPVRSGDDVQFHLPEPIIHWSMGNHIHYEPELKNRGFIFAFEVAPNAPTTTLHISTWNHRLTARIYKTIEEKPISRVDCLDPYTKRRAKQISPEQVEGAWVAQVENVESYPPMEWQGSGHHLRVTPGGVQWSKHAVLIPISIENQGDFAFPTPSILLNDHLGRPVKQAEIVHLQGLAGEDPEIEPGESAKMTFRLLSPARIAKGWGISIAPATFQWSKNQFSTEKPRGPLEGVLTLSLGYFGGAANLSDGLAPATTGWTSVQGIGARVLYGVAKHISIEGALDLSWTGAAELGADQVMSETSGRIQASGLVHAGKRWLPYGKLGLGARFSRSSATMSGMTDTEVLAGLVVSFGGGLAVRINERLLASLSVAYNSPISGTDTSQWVEAGFALGWSWGR